jgi:hypothetical protein
MINESISSIWNNDGWVQCLFVQQTIFRKDSHVKIMIPLELVENRWVPKDWYMILYDLSHSTNSQILVLVPCIFFALIIFDERVPQGNIEAMNKILVCSKI